MLILLLTLLGSAGGPAAPCASRAECLRQAAALESLPVGDASRDEARLTLLLDAACLQGDLPACLKAGHRYRSGRGVPQHGGRATDRFDRVCRTGDQEACALAAETWFFKSPSEREEDDVVEKARARMAALSRSACEKRVWRACWLAGLYERAKIPDDPGDAGKFFESACAHGFVPACLDQADIAGQYGPYPEGHRTALRLVGRACQAGSIQACETFAGWYSTASYVRANEKMSATYRRRAERLGVAACRKGDLDACHHLADFYSDSPAGREAGEIVCRAGYGEACTQLGLLDWDHRRPVTKRAREYLARACHLGNLAGCEHLAEQLEDEKPEQRLAPLRRACELDGTDSCLAAARLSEDASAAAELLERACNLGSAIGCRDLGRAYDRGQGRPRRPDLALGLYRKACERSPEACGPLAQAVKAGAGAPADPVRALKLFASACVARDPESCLVLARAFDKGEGVPANQSSADRLGRWACVGGNAVGCVWQARRLEARGDRGRALAFFYRACIWSDESACDDVERFQGAGGKRPIDLERECTAGRARACFLLADKKSADDVRAWEVPCRLAAPWGCREAAAIHVKAGQDAKALPLLRAGCAGGDGACCAELQDIKEVSWDERMPALQRACELAYGHTCDSDPRTIPPLVVEEPPAGSTPQHPAKP